MKYEILEDMELIDVVIDNVDDFLEDDNKECKYGFSNENVKRFVFKDNKLIDIDFEKYKYFWRDSYDFIEVLSEHMTSGLAKFSFKRINKNLKWTLIAIPNVVLDDDYIDCPARDFVKLIESMDKSNKKAIDTLINNYISHWEKRLEVANKNLNLVKSKLTKETK